MCIIPNFIEISALLKYNAAEDVYYDICLLALCLAGIYPDEFKDKFSNKI